MIAPIARIKPDPLPGVPTINTAAQLNELGGRAGLVAFQPQIVIL
jgi:hypothetical protein